jgi:hypothetical protein
MDSAMLSKLFAFLLKVGVCSIAGPFQSPGGDTLQVIVCPTIQPADPSTTEPTPPVVKPRRTWSL